jgi:hemerythrin-like metal-binding protein
MRELRWQSHFTVGIASIDLEHSRIVAMINKLIKEISNGNISVTKSVLHELNLYVEEHFKHEERLFDVHNYENMNEHIEKHNLFRDKLEAFRNELETQKPKKQTTTVEKELAQVHNVTITKHSRETKCYDPTHDQLVLLSNIARFLFEWLTEHILKEDQKYSKLFVESGVK